jgi:hypothetical protein
VVFVPTISIRDWSLETYITDESASPDDPVQTFPVHEYVPIVPAWQVLKFLDGWLRVCMVEFTHFVPSGKKYAKPDSKNGCPSGVKPCERNRYVAESVSDDCAWARGRAIPSHPMSVSSRKPSARISTAVGMVAANGAVLDRVKDLDFICSSSVVASPRGDSPVDRLPRRAGEVRWNRVVNGSPKTDANYGLTTGLGQGIDR